MAGGGAEQKQSRADHSCKTEVEAAAKGEEPDDGKTEARETDLGLERTVGPSDETRRHPAEEGMHDEVVEKAEADRKQNEISKQRFNHNGRGQWLRRTRKCDR